MTEEENNISISSPVSPAPESESMSVPDSVASPESDETMLEDLKHQIDDVVHEVEVARKLGFKGLIKAYFAKFAGQKEKRPKRL